MKNVITVVITITILAFTFMSCSDSGESPTAPGNGNGNGEVSFADDIQPLLNQNCVTCHGPALTQNGLRLDSYNGLMAGGASGPAVIPNDADGSLIVRKLEGTAAGDRMPQGTERLSDEQIGVIKEWISKGAKNN